MKKFQNKKVLQIGLGSLGGGLATAKYLLNYGACLTICDLKSEAELCQALKKLSIYKQGFKFISERNPSEKEIQENDIIILNPAIPYAGSLVKTAKQLNKRMETDYTIFTDSLKGGRAERYIGVTGTRGKTTTTTWLAHLLGTKAVSGGNIPKKPFLGIINKKADLFITELSSFALEYVKGNTLPPYIAIITNLYPDHLNRYTSMGDYLDTKANIFRFQKVSDYLILHKDNLYSADFLKKKPKAKVYYFSLKKLPSEDNGLYLDRFRIYFQESGERQFLYKLPMNSPEHQNSNLLAALLGAYLYTHDWGGILKRVDTLPDNIPFRQEVIYTDHHRSIINDSAATSPDATLAALNKYGKGNDLILICGGTDKGLFYDELAEKIHKLIRPECLFLLEGSATDKIINSLQRLSYFKTQQSPQIFSSLNVLFRQIPVKKSQGQIILFSPASASFGIFRNEFDRGKQFNRLVKRLVTS